MVQTAQISTPSDHEIVMRREFNAPRELVFNAYTNPDFIPHWWGPRSHTTTVDLMDVRVGGRWRYILHDVDGGTEVALRLLFPTAANRDEAAKFGAIEGGQQTLGRLAEYLATR